MNVRGEALNLSGGNPGYSAADDPSMPWIANALDVRVAAGELGRNLSFGGARVTGVEVLSARCIRYKPVRRCVIEYELELLVDGKWRREALIGKTRAKGVDTRTFELMQRFWCLGFDDKCADGIAVPEPVGVVGKFQMWFSRKCGGVLASELIGTSEGEAIGQRIADAGRKVHLAPVAPGRRHSSDDELRILHGRLEHVGKGHPRLARRLRALRSLLENLRPRIDGRPARGIHRDFYADQILVDGARTYLLDFDLYSAGDPAVDIGNAMAHVTEQALRETGNPASFDSVRDGLLDRYLQAAGSECEAAIRAYETLSLARHIAISDTIPARRDLTESVIELCEQQMGRLN